MRKSTAKATRYAKLKDAMAVPQVLSDFDEMALGSRSHILSIALSRIPTRTVGRLLRVCVVTARRARAQVLAWTASLLATRRHDIMRAMMLLSTTLALALLSSVSALDICGNYCGPTWCDGQAITECPIGGKVCWCNTE